MTRYREAVEQNAMQAVDDVKEFVADATLPSHTPGPWRVSDFDHTEIIMNDLAGTYIAGVRDEAIPYEEARANARLIAAAPELLAALKDARETIERDAQRLRACAEQSHPEERDGHMDGANALIEQVDAAIAKAGGQ
jgi:hypothetical protein